MENEQSKPKGINWKNILIGIAVGAVLIGVGVGVFLLLQPKPEPTSTEPIKVSTPSAKQATPPATATPSAQKDETADWKVYTNKTLGFSIKYPKEWTGIKEIGETDIYKWFVKFSKKSIDEYKHGEIVGIGVDISKGSSTVPQYETVYKAILEMKINDSQLVPPSGHGPVFVVTRLPNITLNGLDGVVKKTRLGEPLDSNVRVEVFVNKNNDYFKFDFSYTSEKDFESDYKIFNLMLSTFKFLPSQ